MPPHEDENERWETNCNIVYASACVKGGEGLTRNAESLAGNKDEGEECEGDQAAPSHGDGGSEEAGVL